MRKLLILFTGLAALPAAASSLFDENSIVEITLRGPLSSVIADKRNREERPFTLSLGGETFNVRVRIRGNSRVQACAFPPLRLNFKKGELKGTTLEGEDKLKLVTHCRNGSERFQDSLLNEYAAYRAFEAMSSFSYRVRLLKVYYEDTDGKQSKLDDPQFGFLIESHEGLAGRLGGQVAKLEAILFSELHADQAARMSLFQYFIGNTDWSFVTADSDDTCCHNINLLRIDGRLVPVPYDFDLAAITRANYRMRNRMNVSTRRRYSGYCRLSVENLRLAIDDALSRKDEIMAVLNDVPALDERFRTHRLSFAADFFEEAADSDRLLAKFEKTCI